MPKVHPNVASPSGESPPVGGASASAAVVLTVWRKSLLFNCSGFTVYNADGGLAFRVDNYAGDRDEIVLMDASGVPLLTVRRKRLSLGEHWMIYDGEGTAGARFHMRKHVGLPRSKALVHVTPCGDCGDCGCYEIEGSYGKRSCAVYGGAGGREVVAEVQRKEAAAEGAGFGSDVFRLVVRPGFDAAVAMGMVVVMEQMFGSR